MTEEAIGLESVLGIGPAFAKKLAEEGVGLRELAEANDDDLDRWDMKLGLRGKPREQDWKGQAIRLLSEHPEAESPLAAEVARMTREALERPVPINDPMKPLSEHDTDALLATVKRLQAELAAVQPTMQQHREPQGPRRRRRLNRHRKFSEVYGRDDDGNVPTGAGFMQVIADETVYFDHDGVELGEGLSQAIEAEPKAQNPEDVNFINWLDKKVTYSWALLYKAIRQRWPNARVENEKKAFAFLHEQLRQNR